MGFDPNSPLRPGKLPVDLLRELLSTIERSDPSIVVGPGVGSDAAVVDVGASLLIAKSDPITFTSNQAARYLIDVNANDIACLGGEPRWLLVTALLPAATSTNGTASDVFASIAASCKARGIALIGGHTEVTDAVNRPVLVGHMLGTVTREAMIAPGGGRPGDRLLVTRPIAIEGTALLADNGDARRLAAIDPGLLASAQALLDAPGISVVADARVLRATDAVRALHDPTEGGLAMAVRELAIACRCGAIVSRQAVPVLPETQAMAAAFGLDPLGMLASGSLLAVIDREKLQIVDDACRAASLPFAWIGKLTPFESGIVLSDANGMSPMPVFETDEVSRALRATDGT